MDRMNDKLPLVEVLANPNPKLFTKQDGRPISFHLLAGDDERCLVAAVRKSIRINGGRYIKYFNNMESQSVLLVTDKGFKSANLHWPAIRITLIGDCIRDKCLKDINEYIHPRDDVKRWRKIDLNEIVYAGRGQFSCRRQLPFSRLRSIPLDDTCQYSDIDEITDLRPQDAQIVPIDDPEDEPHDENENGCCQEETNPTPATNDEIEDVKPKMGFSPKRGRGYQDRYRSREKVAILRYLVDNRKFTNLRGDTVWREMACQNICPNRPWQSLKNHFLKYLLPTLDRYDFLTEEQKIKFLSPKSPSRHDSNSDGSSFFHHSSAKRRLCIFRK
ncbi:Hypothetical protein NTJ_16050 [Nesidiocoris tenuis]|uniref:Telomeric repeat-binding factor 2-interacting protein 1 n=1 Tax=Nesidiocoris tenuis TaxID=355587 RepID=A0ABN7BIC7_9HEMI|nr:Hypothetical protein NTJ_16050 [Nesidiocoris tenuis]